MCSLLSPHFPLPLLPTSNTDNGAYYDFYAYEPDINSKGLVEDILVALGETFKNGTYPGPPIPVKMLMVRPTHPLHSAAVAFTTGLVTCGATI